MKKNYLLLIFIFAHIASVFSQSAIPFGLKLPLYGLKLDSTAFTFTKAIDLREDQSKFASVYEGPLNLHRQYRMKGGFQRVFHKKIFHPLQRKVECGELEVAIAVKKFFIEEKKEDLGVKNGRKRSFEMEVDYYLIDGEKMHYLYTDQMRIDTTINPGKYFFNDFVYDFFEESVLELNNYLTNLSEAQIARLNEDKADPLETNVDTNNLAQIADTSNQIDNDQKFTSVKEAPPEAPRILEEHIVGVERFSGTTAHGISIRYLYFPRKWDSLQWTSAFSVELDVIDLYQNFDNDPDIYAVYYGYFGLGFSAVKPLNNYLFVDLSLKLVFGRESIDKSFFNDKVENNFLFGVMLDQRLMFLLGKEFGLYLTAGVYESFLPTTEFFKTDFGLSIGGGIKF